MTIVHRGLSSSLSIRHFPVHRRGTCPLSRYFPVTNAIFFIIAIIFFIFIIVIIIFIILIIVIFLIFIIITVIIFMTEKEPVLSLVSGDINMNHRWTERHTKKGNLIAIG